MMNRQSIGTKKLKISTKKLQTKGVRVVSIN